MANEDDTCKSENRVVHRWEPLAMFFGFWFGLLFGLIVLAEGNAWFHIYYLVWIAIFLPFFSFAFVRTIEWLTPIHVRAEGIDTYNGFGLKAFVRWENIRGTRNMFGWPGLKWLLLDDGKSYFVLAGIPTFMKDKEAFFQDVVRYAGTDHIVVKALETNGFDKRSW